MTPLAKVEAALKKAGIRKGSGQDWYCPVHGGSRPSLGVTENEETHVALLKCQHGCDTPEVVAALGLRMGDLYPEGEGWFPSDYQRNPNPAFMVFRVGDEVQRIALRRSGEASDPAEDAGDVVAAVKREFLVSQKAPEDFMADALSDEDVLALPPIEYAVDAWFPKGNYSVLYGEPGIGKTFVLLSATRSVRAGVAWFGHKAAPGGALFFQGEGVRQFRTRIPAWDEYNAGVELVEGASFERTFDLTKPEAVAAVIRTVRAFEERHGVVVQLLVIEPLVEFMTGEENGEGMELASRGLRALARLLPDTAVVAGHHTNAAGERERGAAFLRMRAGTFARVEGTETGIALYQHKSRDGVARAVQLEPVAVGESIVFQAVSSGDARTYITAKESAKKIKREVEAIEKREGVAELILREVMRAPGVAVKSLLKALHGCGMGTDKLKDLIEEMTSEGLIRVEIGPRQAHLLYPVLTDVE